MPHVLIGPTRYIGRSFSGDDGLAFIRKAFAAPFGGFWREGAPISKQSSIAVGTAIALFAHGRYPLSGNWDRQCAVYLGQNSLGIDVLDLSMDGVIHRETITWAASGQASAATDFSVAEW